ncbi:hypothetical protein Cme02nite_66410 [Catellatospora methionotrophica]|uniref:Uncharacterized protein n=1 Tax=Catellatospora methionotrophica TaxID=121620 RepID=A0A8J3LMJ1_9ACTN|nr:hypothetical protein [Catellatospora methionotrophica]GIG18309.1 hypothetical protein Cme02nite_66410 [Catellatospora methionotrophica]
MTNPIADISVPELSRRIASLERQEVGRSALDVCTLTMDLRHQYRRALVARDQAALALVTRERWTAADVAEVICGHRACAPRAAVILEWTGLTPDDGTARDLADRQQIAEQLRELLSLAYDKALRLIPAAPVDLNLPAEPTARLAYCAHWLRFVDGYRAANEASRILFAAILVHHHGWPVPDVAELGGVTTDEVSAALAAAAASPPSDADSGLLAQLALLDRVLEHNTERLLAVRDRALTDSLADGVPERIVAAHIGTPDQERSAAHTMEPCPA